MFCTNCGTKLQDGANWCQWCGAKITPASGAAAPSAPAGSSGAQGWTVDTAPPHDAYGPITDPAPVPPPVPSSAAAPPPLGPTVSLSSASPSPLPGAPSDAPLHGAVKCSWCGNIAEAGESSCPKCGAALDVPEERSASGWLEVPGRKDMAKLQLRNSSCQIEGTYVPVADLNLAAGDTVYFTHHVLLWKDPGVTITTMSMRGGWSRLFAGLPLIMTQATGPGHIAFSKDDPGELMPVPMQPGDEIDVREHLFLAATSSVEYDWFQTNVWFKTQSGNDTETHYPVGAFMDRFRADSPGLLLLHAGGNVFTRNLGPSESILIKPSALVFKDPSVQMHLHFEHPNTFFSGWGSWGNRYLWLRMIGPGRVAVQSVFDKIEGESRNLSGYSYATKRAW